MACPAEYTIPITRRDVINVVKKLIAKMKGISNWQTDVLLRHKLREDLHFNEMGIRAMTPDLNDCFASVSLALTPDPVQKCITVEDLCTLIWNNIDEKYK